MSPDRDDRNDDLDPDTYEEEPPRSIFAATWFRAVLILIVLGVIGAVAVPYILDAVNPPPTQQAVVKSAPLPSTPPSPPPAPARPPAAPTAAPPADDAASARALPPPSAPRSTPPAALPESPKPAAPAAKTPGPLAKAEVPAAKPSASAKPESTAPKPEARASSPAVSADSTAKKPAAGTPARATTKKPSEPRQVAAKTAAPAAAGVYWVQVGAFKDEETAKRLAARLREQNFKVADVTGGAPAPAASAATPSPTASPNSTTSTAPAGVDQYDVFVTGPPPSELTTRLTAKGLAVEPSGTGVVIKPSLPLRDAVSLSKDLAVDGYKVQVRRAGGADATRATARPQPPATAAVKTPAAGDGLFRVRVGSFTERAAAVAALRELEAKGYKPFIARGER